MEITLLVITHKITCPKKNRIKSPPFFILKKNQKENIKNEMHAKMNEYNDLTHACWKIPAHWVIQTLLP